MESIKPKIDAEIAAAKEAGLRKLTLCVDNLGQIRWWVDAS
jgi:hypothetical protein